MRNTILALATLTIAAAPLSAQTLRAAPSTRATVEVALSFPRDSAPAGAQPATIRIDYGQPHLRGRALHTDSLVPYDKPWRTGANAATTLVTGADLTIGGVQIPRGTYVLFTLPSATGWKLMVQRPAPGTNPMQAAMQYVAGNDVARIDLRRQELSVPMEALTFWLVPSTAPGSARGELRFAWGNSMLSTDWSVR